MLGGRRSLTYMAVVTLFMSRESSLRQGEMADSKRKRGKSDRSRVSGSEPYEVYYVARKFGVSADTVRKVIKRVA